MTDPETLIRAGIVAVAAIPLGAWWARNREREETKAHFLAAVRESEGMAYADEDDEA